MKRRHADIVSGISLLAFAGLLFIAGGLMPTRPGAPRVLNTGFYPQMLAVFLGLLSALLILESARRQSGGGGEPKFWGNFGAFALFAVTLGMLCAFPPLMQVLGFAMTCLLFTTALTWLLSGKETRRLRSVLSVSLGITALVYT
ncbi:MAG TPA: tripartite tricarboxylate transporter TctB family protein, partial [Magnetospirillaceae bacterium]|nr:tripartite tricarboxylate transporter TctB family protein [Magnetospirillaceae bacterium]